MDGEYPGYGNYADVEIGHSGRAQVRSIGRGVETLVTDGAF